MRLFVAEYFTSGQCPGIQAENSFFQEGWGMLLAFLEDAVRAADCERFPLECQTLLGEEPLALLPAGVDLYRPTSPRHAHQLVLELASAADLTLIIAPETEGILRSQYDAVQSARGSWLGCDRDTIELCGDKLRLAELWNSIDLPTPATRLLSQVAGDLSLPEFPVVIKPRDGAGGDQTTLCASVQEWNRVRNYTTPEEQALFLVQPFVEGHACSVSILSLRDHDEIFPPGEQRTDWEGGFRYFGGRVPCEMPSATRHQLHEYIRLIRRAIPGLAGYWGLDFVWSPRDQQQPITLLEINPRLTTSYLGYRQLTSTNLAEFWLRDACHLERENHAFSWLNEPITF